MRTTKLFTRTGENSKESVFEVQYTGVVGNNWDCLHCNAGNYMPQSNGPRSPLTGRLWGLKNGWGINIISKNLYAAYENNDKRRNVTIYAPAKDKYGQKVVKIQDTTIKSILLQKVNQRYQLTP